MNNPREQRREKIMGAHVLTGIRVTQPVLERLHEIHTHFLKGVRNGRKLVMRRCDLSELDFTGMDFSYAEMLACDFKGSKLRSAIFRSANLFAADFTKTDLGGANFVKADLRASTFERADLTDAEFEGADLRECAFIDDETNEVGKSIASTFRGPTLRGTNMAQSKLKKANFNGAVLDNTNLTNADMRETRFQGAEFVNANLNGARLGDADLRSASLGDMDLTEIDLSSAKTATEVSISDEWLWEKLDAHKLGPTCAARTCSTPICAKQTSRTARPVSCRAPT